MRDKDIIKILIEGISPPQVVERIKLLWKTGTPAEKSTKRSLYDFHNLLVSIAQMGL